MPEFTFWRRVTIAALAVFIVAAILFSLSHFGLLSPQDQSGSASTSTSATTCNCACKSAAVPNSTATSIPTGVCKNPSYIVECGVKALRQRVPGDFIRGMIDTEHPDLHLNDFEQAARILAPMGDSRAQFIIGWLCEDNDVSPLEVDTPSTQVFSEEEIQKLGLQPNEKLALPWYSASAQSCGAAWVAIGNMLERKSPEDNHFRLEKAFEYYKEGMALGDTEARVLVGYCYAFGRGVKANGPHAWDFLSEVIKNGDEENSIYAVCVTIQAWKDGKLKPPAKLTNGAKTAYDFVKRYADTMCGASLDELYTNHGFTPDPYPVWRRDLAIKVRKDWLKAME